MERHKENDRLRRAIGKYGGIAVILLAGVVLLLWPSGGREEAVPQQPLTQDLTLERLQETEERMQRILSGIEGVGKLELMLTASAVQKRELAMNTELSYRGAVETPDEYRRRSEIVVVSGDNGEEPLVVREIVTEYQGALVVCQGGGNAEVKLAVTQAVSALTGLGSDRITVVKCQS